MTYHPDDTICAIATAAGGAARGMVRVSGPRAIDVAAACFEATDRRPLSEVWQAECIVGFLRIDLTACAKPRSVPCELFVWPTSRSYTREPVVELHTLGSPPVLEAVLAAVCRGGARLAEPGEFTLRAFLAGRIDLTQAEAVLGVIDAQGVGELSAALTQLAGGLAQPLDELRDQLLQLLAELEAGLDFVDEDIEFITAEELVAQLESARKRLADVAQQMTHRGTAGAIPQVTLVGLPNAGKSSLFNALITRYGARDGVPTEHAAEALVSPQQGTTRDYLTAAVEFGGARCELVDTAGIDELGARARTEPTHSETRINEAAQAMAAEQRERAAIRVWCSDGAASMSPRTSKKVDLHESNWDVIVVTKADLMPQPSQVSSTTPTIVTSSVTGVGIQSLGAVLGGLLARESNAVRGQVISTTADRCRESIRLADVALQRAQAVAMDDSGDELVAIELRDALAELGKVVGAVYTDDLLDRIFKTFCIGK